MGVVGAMSVIAMSGYGVFYRTTRARFSISKAGRRNAIDLSKRFCFRSSQGLLKFWFCNSTSLWHQSVLCGHVVRLRSSDLEHKSSNQNGLLSDPAF